MLPDVHDTRFWRDTRTFSLVIFLEATPACRNELRLAGTGGIVQHQFGRMEAGTGIVPPHSLLEAWRRFELLNKGFADPCLTTWLPGQSFNEWGGIADPCLTTWLRGHWPPKCGNGIPATCLDFNGAGQTSALPLDPDVSPQARIGIPTSASAEHRDYVATLWRWLPYHDQRQ